MTSVEELAVELQELFGRKAEELGRRSGFIQRERVITGASFAQGLVFGYLSNPYSSLGELCQGLSQAGADVSRQGLVQRMDQAGAEFLRQLVGAAVGCVVAGARQDSDLLQRFSGVYLRDSTMVELPLVLAEAWQGCGGYAAGKMSASLKIAVEWEVQRGQLVEVELRHGRTHDQTAKGMAPLPSEALLIQDLGFFNLTFFKTQSQQGVYWLTRYKTGVGLFTPTGQALSLLTYLQTACATPDQRHECLVLVGATQQLPARLIAEKVPVAVVAQRRARLVEAARVAQTSVSPLSWELAAWTILLTNADATLICLRAVSCPLAN